MHDLRQCHCPNTRHEFAAKFRRSRRGSNVGLLTTHRDVHQFGIRSTAPCATRSSNSGAMIGPSPKEPWPVWVLHENEEGYDAVV
jgi:hypothetical protein